MYKSNINLNLYKTFYDVAMHGSFSKTAEQTYMSQPAISKSIKKLESDLGIELFYRKPKGVELTEKGKELLYYVEKSYGNLLTAERVMIETENLERGKLSIGMPSNVGTFYLFDKVIDFHKKYPNIEITIITGGTNYLLNLLDSHTIDFIIDTAPIDINLNDALTCKKLTSVNYCFAIRKNSKLIDYKKIKSIRELSDKPLILPIPGTANRKDLDNLFQKNNVNIENVINIHTSEMIVSSIKKDLGIGYIIYDVIKQDVQNNDLDIINVSEELPTVDIDIVFNKKFLTTAPITFIENYIDSKIIL